MKPIGARAGQAAVFRTSCGQQVVVGRWLLPEPLSIGRVTMRLDCRHENRDMESNGTPAAEPAEPGELWVSLTVAEARLLAEHLLSYAEAVERTCAREHRADDR